MRLHPAVLCALTVPTQYALSERSTFATAHSLVNNIVNLAGAYYVRPYAHDSTASRQLSEVKHVPAQPVLRWVTTLEPWVLNVFGLVVTH